VDHVPRTKSACHSGGDQRPATMAPSFLGTRKRPCSAALSAILFCFIMLLGSPARGQSETDGRLAPQDTVEVRVSGWSALRGGVAEGAALNGTFTIGAAGTINLPTIGHVPAAGLHANELAKLITDRLQARSGFHERPVTTVRRKQHLPLDIRRSAERRPAPEVPSARASTNTSSVVARKPENVEGRPPEAHPRVNGFRASGKPATTEKQQALERERSKANALMRDLVAVRMEVERARGELLAARQAAQDDAVRYNQGLTAERRHAATLTQELSAVRADLKAVKAQTAQETNAASRARQAAEALANKEHELAVRERAKGAALEQNLLAASREINALKNSAQSAAGEREEALRRELAMAREELDAMRRAARDASAQARQVADAMAKQERAFEEQRQKAEGLARDLTLVQREVESLNAKAVLAAHEKAAAFRARHTAQASVAEARRALDEERHKVELFERDLAAARQATDALRSSANLAAAAQAAAVQGRQAAEATTKQAGEALALEREKADAVARDLDTARLERDAAKEEVTRVSAAWQQERDRASGLARDLTAALNEIDALKALDARPTARTVRAPKARATDRARPHTTALAKRARSAREVRKAEVNKPSRSVRLTTIVLPDALLPTRPPLQGEQGTW
jgi:hypothetical protein